MTTGNLPFSTRAKCWLLEHDTRNSMPIPSLPRRGNNYRRCRRCGGAILVTYRDYNFAHHRGRKVRETHWLLQSEAIATEVRGLTVFDDWHAAQFRDGRQGITAQASVKGIQFKAQVASRDGQYWQPFMLVAGAPCGEAQYLTKTTDIQRAAQACEKRAKSIIIDAALDPIEAQWQREKTQERIEHSIGRFLKAPGRNRQRTKSR